MAQDQLNYGQIMQRALRRVMNEALSLVADIGGLPGEHHFYITFDCRHPGVDMPDWLRAEYPEQMTIVIQHEFYNLQVTEDAFSVEMSFHDRPAGLTIPFDAVLTFVDPSVEFGLKFDATEAEDADEPEEEAPEVEEGSAEVLSLDSFRKN